MATNPIKFDKSKFSPAIIDASAGEVINKPSLNAWQDAWLRLKKNKAAVASIVVIILVILLAFLGPVISDKDPKTQTLPHNNLPAKIPVLENISWLPFDGMKTLNNGTAVDVYEQKKVDTYYWFGTDSLGRDLFTRVCKGTQISLYIAFLAALLDMLIGVSYGAVSGYFGGKLDNYMQRFTEILSSIPNLVIVILMILVFKPGLMSITIALAFSGWVSMARVVRAQTLKMKEQEFVMASRTLGATHMKIIFKHILPNMVGVILINTMFSIPNAIFFEAFLSFIGLGLQDPLASLGTLIDDGFKTLRLYPHLVIYPAVFISLIMICFNMIADGLRDAMDPKMRD